MACNLTSIQTAACVSGIAREQSTVKLLQLIAQLTCEAAEAGGGADQSPWTSDIDGGGFDLNNVSNLEVTTINGVAPVQLNQVVKTANQDVNTATLTNDTQLKFTGLAAGLYQVELYLKYGGNAAADDFRGNFTWTAIGGGFPTMVYHHQNSADAATVTAVIGAAAGQSAPIVLGVPSGIGTVRTARGSFLINLTAVSTIQWQFANTSGNPVQAVRCFAGSKLTAQLIA